MKTVSLSQRRTVIATLAAFGFLAAGIAGLRTSTAHTAPGGGAPQAMPVMVATVEPASVALWEEFSGRLEAVDRVDVRSRVAGAIQSVHFTEGALVNRGDLLLTIDPAPYAAAVSRAEAQVVAAKARLDQAKSDLERAQRLWNERAIAQRELDSRTNGEREAQANLAAAEAALQSARLDLGYTQVRAPIAGRVGKLEITAGNLVPAGPTGPVLATLVSQSPIYASFEADEQAVARALRDVGGPSRAKLQSIPVEMRTATSGDASLRGKLQLIDNQVNARSGTVRLRAVFDNADGSLMAGQYATLRLGQSRPQPALLVSERAVGTDQSKKFVMVVGDDNKAAYREVVLGAAVDGMRIVTSGLQPHERIVVDGLQRVQPGTLVAPQPTKMARN